MSDNKTSKYFKYAIGEIVLVVIGILIALSINNWNENRKLKFQEVVILEELNKNLLSNIEIIEDFITYQECLRKELVYLIDHFDKKQVYTDTFGYYLRNVRKAGYLSLVSSSFESLKSTGFNLIRNDY